MAFNGKVQDGQPQVQADDQEQPRHQNVVVMRHGDRIDNFEALWTVTAARPWDPPLTEEGLIRAFCTGKKIRDQVGFPIHRVFVSPFLRCLQTASEVVSAVCAVSVSEDPNNLTSNGIAIDPSKIKVSIEYGLCEMLNTRAIRHNVAPKDGNFAFEISQCEAHLPEGTVDHSAEHVHEKLPKWEESVEEARNRYVEVIKALACKYPTENLLFVTHGEGIGAVHSKLRHGVEVCEVEYCGYSHFRKSQAEDFVHVSSSGVFFIEGTGGSSGRSLTELINKF